MKSGLSSMVKVIGQRSRSPGWKRDFLSFKGGMVCICHFVMTPDVMWHHAATSWRHATSRHDIMTFFGNFWARILTRRACRGRAHQRSGVFILWWFWAQTVSAAEVLWSISFCGSLIILTQKTFINTWPQNIIASIAIHRKINFVPAIHRPLDVTCFSSLFLHWN